MEIAVHWNRDFSNHFAWESKFVPVIGILKIGGKRCLAGDGKLGLLQNMGNFKTPRVRESWFYCTLPIALNNSKARWLERILVSLNKKLHNRFIPLSSRLTHKLSPRRRNLDKWISGGYVFNSFIMLKLGRRLKCRFFSSLTTNFSMQSHRNQELLSTVFCELSVRRSKYCLEFSITWGRLTLSRWPFHSYIYIFRNLAIINSLRFSKV